MADYPPRIGQSYMTPTRLSRWLYARFPRLYDPDPEIFMERYANEGELVGISRPTLVLGPECRKALLFTYPEGELHVAGRTFCGMTQTGIRQLLAKRGGWYDPTSRREYLVLGRGEIKRAAARVHPGDRIAAAGVPSPARDFLGVGWSGDETWGIWSDGEEANIRMLIDDCAAEGLTITLTLSAFVGEAHPEISMVAYANGQYIGQQKFENGEPLPKRVELTLPCNVVNERRGALDLRLRIEGAVSPQALGMSADGRVLGIGLIQLDVSRLP
jgi:hypothetical protein